MRYCPLIHGPHSAQQVDEQAIQPLHKGCVAVRHDDHEQAQKVKDHHHPDGEANSQDGYLRRGAGHEPQ